VASFATLALPVASTASSPSVPAAVQHKVAALFGSSGYIPGWLPPGLIYISWKPLPPSGPNGSVGRFTITFAHAGKILLWEMLGPPDASDCPSSYAGATIGGRRVAYVNGNHGQSGFWCFGPSARSEIDTWDAHVFAPNVAMKIVAGAVLAR
jgi:hypothetical protein